MIYLLSSLLVYIFIAGVQNFYNRGMRSKIAVVADFSGVGIITFMILSGIVQ
ncbi:MAG: hypothetical protein JW989_01230 [Chlorobiaceae bacterium]|jgi:hypothetical protein|nr:hypothetical protein [Chlorobiaceae bacterium]